MDELYLYIEDHKEHLKDQTYIDMLKIIQKDKLKEEEDKAKGYVKIEVIELITYTYYESNRHIYTSIHNQRTRINIVVDKRDLETIKSNLLFGIMVDGRVVNRGDIREPNTECIIEGDDGLSIMKADPEYIFIREVDE